MIFFEMSFLAATTSKKTNFCYPPPSSCDIDDDDNDNVAPSHTLIIYTIIHRFKKGKKRIACVPVFSFFIILFVSTGKCFHFVPPCVCVCVCMPARVSFVFLRYKNLIWKKKTNKRLYDCPNVEFISFC